MTDNELKAIITKFLTKRYDDAAKKIKRLSRSDMLRLVGTQRRSLGVEMSNVQCVEFEDFITSVLESVGK